MSKKQGGPVRLGKALRLLAGAAMAVLLPAVAPAQQKTLYVGMNGGGMAEAYAKHVFPDFERAQGVRIEWCRARRPRCWPAPRRRRASPACT